MKPEIFMDDFERTEYSDAIYSILGRALTVASRFESLCKSYATLIGIKESSDILHDEEKLQRMFDRIRKASLYSSIKKFIGENVDFEEILRNARIARNEIVHEISLGLDRCIDLLPKEYIENLIYRVLELSEIIAEADRIVSFLLTLETHDCMPNIKFIENYPNNIKQWVLDSSDKMFLGIE